MLPSLLRASCRDPAGPRRRAVACFAGYRLFRIVLAIYGFILGAMMASSMMGVSNTAGMIVAALVGGIAGALDPGVRVLRRHRARRRRPRRAASRTSAWSYVGDRRSAGDRMVIVLAVLGAIGAMLLQRYVDHRRRPRSAARGR